MVSKIQLPIGTANYQVVKLILWYMGISRKVHNQCSPAVVATGQA